MSPTPDTPQAFSITLVLFHSRANPGMPSVLLVRCAPSEFLAFLPGGSFSLSSLPQLLASSFLQQPSAPHFPHFPTSSSATPPTGHEPLQGVLTSAWPEEGPLSLPHHRLLGEEQVAGPR